MFYLIILYLIFYILGIDLGYLSNPFDEYRLAEIFLALCACFYLIIQKKYFNTKTLFILYFLFLYICFKIVNSDIFFIQDLIMWLIIFFIYLSLYEKKYLNSTKENVIAILVIFSVFPCFFIFFSIFNFLKQNTWYDWKFNYGSIRFFDSYIIPIFWLSLYLYSKKNKLIYKFYYIICFFIALSLFFNGSRSAVISLIIPLFILFFIFKKDRWLTLKTILNFFFAFLLYFSINYMKNFMHNSNVNLGISRFTTSKRYEIWEFLYENWKNTPFLGIGGGFLAKEQYIYGHHAHNLFLRLFFEWGIIGLGLIIFMIYQMYILFKSKVYPVLKMGVLAIFIDAMFSGNFVYPASQILCVFFIAITFSYIDFNECKKNLMLSKIIILCYIFLFIYMIFNFLWVDITCVKCHSGVGRAAPFFWEYGGSEHLE